MTSESPTVPGVTAASDTRRVQQIRTLMPSHTAIVAGQTAHFESLSLQTALIDVLTGLQQARWLHIDADAIEPALFGEFCDSVGVIFKSEYKATADEFAVFLTRSPRAATQYDAALQHPKQTELYDMLMGTALGYPAASVQWFATTEEAYRCATPQIQTLPFQQRALQYLTFINRVTEPTIAGVHRDILLGRERVTLYRALAATDHRFKEFHTHVETQLRKGPFRGHF